MPSVYQRLLNTAFHISKYRSKLLCEDRDDSVSKSFLFDSFFTNLKCQALAMPATHRGRYQAFTLLLPMIGAESMVNRQSNGKTPIALLIEAVKERDVASSCSSLITSILRAMIQKTVGSQEESKQSVALAEIRALWGEYFVCALCSADAQMRRNTADYLLPEILKVDSSSGPFIMACTRRLFGLSSSIFHSAISDESKRELCLWGLVNVFLHARLLGVSGSVISDSTIDNEGISADELQEAALCANDDVRLCALTALTASLKSSLPISSSELTILRRSLPFSLKASHADQRHQVVRTVKALVLRISEHSRACVRDVASLRLGREKISDLEKRKAFDEDIARREVSISQASEAMHWLRDELISRSLFPGSSPDREMTSLDVLRCVFESATISSTKSVLPKEQLILSCFTESPSVVRVLLNVLLSSWDRSRRLAADLLLCLSRPLPGFESVQSVKMLVQWAFRLAGKAKLRESDAGAVLLRDIFIIYASHLSWELHLPTILASSLGVATPLDNLVELKVRDSKSSQRACRLFIESLNQIIAHRLTSLATLFSSMNLQEVFAMPSKKCGEALSTVILEKSEVPFCHGLLLSLKYCLQASFQSKLFEQDSLLIENRHHWESIIKAIYETTLRALQIAMTVVAEAASDAPFAPIFGTDASKNIGHKGPINASSGYGMGSVGGQLDGDSLDMAASYINANSVLDGDGVDSISGDDIQRVVVAAWLVVKEASSLLAFLVEISPSTAQSGSSLLSDEDIATAGYTLLDNLSRLKHMGAIAESHTALQSVCSTLLRLNIYALIFGCFVNMILLVTVIRINISAAFQQLGCICY